MTSARQARRRRFMEEQRKREREAAERKPPFTPPLPWEPMQRRPQLSDPQLDELAERNADIAEDQEKIPEVWINNQYVVTVRRYPEGPRDVRSLSIRRLDRKAVDNWRHKQRIKNEIAGRNVEGIELYPNAERTVDLANQYWIFCFRPGVILPFGFGERAVSGDNHPDFPMSRQKPFGKGERKAI